MGYGATAYIKSLERVASGADKGHVCRFAEKMVKSGVPAETLAQTVRETAFALEVSVQELIPLAVKYPPLVVLPTRSVIDRVNAVAEYLKISAERFIAMAKTRPWLFGFASPWLFQVVADLSTLLQVPEETIVEASFKDPQLLCAAPMRVSSRMTELAHLLDLTREQGIAVALRRPALFQQSPQAVAVRVSSIARNLGVGFGVVVAAGLRDPALFIRSPEAVAERLPLLLELARVSEDRVDIGFILARFPQAFTYSVEHIQARTLLSSLRLSKAKLPSLMIMPSRKVDQLLVEHFRRDCPTPAEADRMIRRLRRQGLIRHRVKKLTDGTE